MKFATFALLGMLLLGSFASVQAAERTALTSPGAGQRQLIEAPAASAIALDAFARSAAGEAVLAFLGVPLSTEHPNNPNEPYICGWYPLLLGDLTLESLFAPSAHGAPAVDKEHAYLLWVSDYDAQVLSSTDGGFTLMLVPTGTATIYFKDTPLNRIWTDPTQRSTWGVPVAKFVRKAGIFQSADGGYSGTMISTAELVSSLSFTLNGRTFNFRDLIPHGMTCYEAGVDVAESGTCVAVGGGLF